MLQMDAAAKVLDGFLYLSVSIFNQQLKKEDKIVLI